MAGLFGTQNATSQANTLGDLSKDVALNTPPDDSVSDISFSPQSEHLAVASWDKKVRIYEITQSGGSTGKAFFEHEAPVLSCSWSPVSITSMKITPFRRLIRLRMAQRSLEQEQTKLRVLSTWEQTKIHQLKSPPTINPYAAYDTLSHPDRMRR